MSNSDYKPLARSSYARSMNELIKAEGRYSNPKRAVAECTIVDVYSGEESPHDTGLGGRDKHVWWVLRLPGSETTVTVRCAHDYDYIQANMGNVASQVGRKATINFRGESHNDMENGYAVAAPDYRSEMRNPTLDSVTFSIGALLGILDDGDPLDKMQRVGGSSENSGPRYV